MSDPAVHDRRAIRAVSIEPTTVTIAPSDRSRERGRVAASPAAGRRLVASAATDEGRFLAYAAHELRTPLAAQRCLLELALADPQTDANGWREIGRDVLAASRQQERLLEACLTLARSWNGLERREPVDLAPLARDALRAHARHELACGLTLEPTRTSGDPELIARLISNLLSNAITHNVPGGRLDVATTTAAGRALLSIRNSGPLVPAADLARLFEPFQRLESAAGSASRGIGLGLAIVRAIADLHEAALTAQAGPGGGLVVEVAFPALIEKGTR